MKKLLLLFIPLVFFFSCEDEDTSGYNCTSNGCFSDPANAQYLTLEDCESACVNTYNDNNNNNGNNDNEDGTIEWWWDITINGNTYAAAGTYDIQNGYCGVYNGGVTGYGSLSNGMMTLYMSIGDITSDYYVEGGYVGLGLNVITPFEGSNEAYITPYYGPAGNDFLEYFPSGISYYGISGDQGSTYMDAIQNNLTSCSNNLYYNYSCIDINLSSLGQTNCAQNIEGSLSTTLYALDPDSDGIEGVGVNDTFSIPVELEVNFSLGRYL